MDGKLYQIKVNTRFKTLTVAVILPDVNLYSPASSLFCGESRDANLCVKITEIRKEFTSSSLTEAQEDELRSASRRLTDASAMQRVAALAMLNKTEKQQYREALFCKLAVINKGDFWEWKTEYGDLAVSKLGDQNPLLPEEVAVYDDDFIGCVGTAGQCKLTETRSFKRGLRDQLFEKIEVVTSFVNLENIKENREKEIFAVSKGAVEYTSIYREDQLIVPEGYYEEMELEEGFSLREWENAYYTALKDDEKYKKIITLLAAITICLPGQKKLFLVCQHDKDGSDFGCGKSRRDCHLSIVKQQIISAIMSEKNKLHDAVMKTAEGFASNFGLKPISIKQN